MKEEILRITGMHCSGCVRSVTNALLRVEGVKEVEIFLKENSARVQFEENLASIEKMDAELNALGYFIK
jgi:copper chaperone